MSQITLYLDKETEQLVLEGAKASGVSKSRWVADAIRRHAHEVWPAEIQHLAGAFPDFPLREDMMPEDEQVEDLPRVGF